MARRVTGDRQLARLLTKLAAQTEPICVESLQAWADDVQDAAKRRVPVLTGALRDAIERRI
ncbi:HK97 gp10 family phage protein [Pseudonocardia hispaniensis]|uniref:HK97 gp10 family phage protein n=1 Tax=Pseudonocardia hispaniensis TaxID=904933 RepID=A0ABW1J8M6_9PSEU